MAQEPVVTCLLAMLVIMQYIGFFVLSRDALNYNAIIESNNFKFFEPIFPLSEKISLITQPNIPEKHEIEKLRSKRSRTKTSFSDNLYT